MKKGLSLVISFCAIGISIVAICTSLDGFCLSETAYLGWIVAVLSTLVVVLIGWQIYSVIDFKASTKKIESLADMVSYQISNVNLATGMALSDYYYRVITEDKRDIEFKYIYYSVISIMHASSIKEIKTCNAIVKPMLEVIVRPEKIKLSKYNKELIFKIISQVKHGNEIENYGDLLQKLALIESV
jgi:hypothetical protein